MQAVEDTNVTRVHCFMSSQVPPRTVHLSGTTILKMNTMQWFKIPSMLILESLYPSLFTFMRGGKALAYLDGLLG